MFKCKCIKGCRWNLTQPYFKFNEGEVYEFTDHGGRLAHTNRNKYLYVSKYCDWVLVQSVFDEYFVRVEDHRDNRLKEIGI